jgi:hypothetical protein
METKNAQGGFEGVGAIRLNGYKSQSRNRSINGYQ